MAKEEAYRQLRDWEKLEFPEELYVAFFGKEFDEPAKDKNIYNMIFEKILSVKDLEGTQHKFYQICHKDHPQSSQDEINRLLGNVWFKFLKAAAKVGNLSLVQWLSERVYVDQEVLHAAVLSGNINLVKWLLTSGVAKPPPGYRLDNIDELMTWEASNKKSKKNEKKQPANSMQSALQELKNRSALESKMSWQRLRYDALFMIFCIVFIVTAAISASVVWPTFAAVGACGTMAIKKAYLDKIKFAKGVLGFYIVGLAVALILSFSLPGSAYSMKLFTTLGPLVVAMSVLGLPWYISILRASKNSTKAKTIGVVVLFFIAAVSVVLGNSFAPYLPSAFSGQLAIKLSMIIGFAITIIPLVIAWANQPDDTSASTPIANWSGLIIPADQANINLLRKDWLIHQPAPQPDRAKDLEIEISPLYVPQGVPTNERKADADDINPRSLGPAFFQPSLEQKNPQPSASVLARLG